MFRQSVDYLITLCAFALRWRTYPSWALIAMQRRHWFFRGHRSDAAARRASAHSIRIVIEICMET